MPDVFLSLGAAVVKVALRVWSKGDAPVSDSVVDLMKGKISGDLEQRKAQRLFEDLEVPVADRLKVIRNTEFRALPDNEWQAAVLAAKTSFASAELSAQQLLSRDLDPLSIEQLIRADSRSVTRDLSADGVAFYDRMINEGSSYIVEIADKLPHFRTGVIAELLSRDREIVELIAEVLDRIPKQVPGKAREAGFLTAYLRYITTKLDRLEIFGLDFEASWYPLSIAYVSLQVSTRRPTSVKHSLADYAQTTLQGPSFKRAFKGLPPTPKEPPPTPLLIGAQRLTSVEDTLVAFPRIMLHGRAGSGKTTVLQWLAVRAARADFTAKLAAFSGYVPFYIRLREYVKRGLPQPEDFISGIAPMLAAEFPRGWVRDQLRSGRSLVLIDGVDELPERRRASVSNWLSDLCQLFPDARYIVSTRPAAVKQRWLAALNFHEVSLEAMSPVLAEKFIHNWYEAFRERLADNEERQRLTGYELSILRDIKNDRHLRDLADTPLLAGLLCALNRHLRSQLPRRRSDIYERAIVMLDQRDRTRQISSDISLDLNAKVHLLADLALWMIRNGESEIDSSAAKDVVTRSLGSLANIDLSTDSVYQFLLERSGLLREPTVQRVDFIHRTFEEYLAARAAIDSDAVGELVRNAGDVQWQEVVLFAAGHANLNQANRLIQGLLTHPRKGTRRDQRIFAISCLREVRSLNAGLRQSAQSMIPSLLPPQSMSQAEELSGLGTRLIKPLLTRLRQDMNMAPEAIRAASLVGGQSALELIEYVAKNYGGRSSKLQEEILRAWQYFDHDDYAQRVVEPLRDKGIKIPDL